MNRDFPEDDKCAYYPCDEEPQYSVIVAGGMGEIAKFCGPHLSAMADHFKADQRRNFERERLTSLRDEHRSA